MLVSSYPLENRSCLQLSKPKVLQGLMTVVYISTCMWFFFTQMNNVRTMVRLKWYKSQDVTCDPTDS